MGQQKPGVGFKIVFHTELNKNPVTDVEASDKELDDPVLSPLGEDPELISLEPRFVLDPQLPCFDSSESLLNSSEIGL